MGGDRRTIRPGGVQRPAAQALGFGGPDVPFEQVSFI
jgi:hypothetical protein